MKHIKTVLLIALLAALLLTNSVSAMAADHLRGGDFAIEHPQTQKIAFGDGVLLRGSVSYYVMNVQLALIYGGFLSSASGDANGHYDLTTEIAVENYQKAKGLEKDGKVGNNTKDSLWSLYSSYLKNNGVLGMQ